MNAFASASIATVSGFISVPPYWPIVSLLISSTSGIPSQRIVHSKLCGIAILWLPVQMWGGVSSLVFDKFEGKKGLFRA
jgi:hypothetical protein